MAVDPDKVRAAYTAWMEVNKECMDLWLELAQGKRIADQALMLELGEKAKRLYAVFLESWTGFSTGSEP